jgi:catechol 2,3-dioxygenase-like lactoylglutathione lyase family enzyme
MSAMQRLGPIRQIAYLVNDIEDAMHHWHSVMGIGPFFYIPRRVAAGFQDDGRSRAPEYSFGFAQSGQLQIELIQQHNDAPTAFLAWKQAGRQGMHHIAFWTDTFDEAMQRLLTAGHHIIQAVDPPGGGNRNAFLARQGHDGTLMEISETSGSKGRFFARVAEASVGWDGTDPVRLVAKMS